MKREAEPLETVKDLDAQLITGFSKTSVIAPLYFGQRSTLPICEQRYGCYAQQRSNRGIYWQHVP
jgi:hypothetical protein